MAKSIDDPLGLIGQRFDTLPSQGRIERRIIEASDPQRLVAALIEDEREAVSNDDIYATGQRMGWSIARTELARIDAVRAGLLSR